MIKILIFLTITLLLLTGCSEEFPPPEKAFIACIENGGIPIYASSATDGTQYTCKQKKEEDSANDTKDTL